MQTSLKISTGPVTPSAALDNGLELEKAIAEVIEGTRKPDSFPIEPICRLLQFVRDVASPCEDEQKNELAGRAAYNAYCGTRNWKSFKGEPLPKWEQSPEDIRAGWRQAAMTIRQVAELWRVQATIDSGFAGVSRSGGIVDRRIDPTAIPIQKNSMMGTPEPKVAAVVHRSILPVESQS